MKPFALFFVGFCYLQLTLWANLKVADIFSSNMVLQCDRPIPIWGEADPGSKIAIQFGAQSVSGVTDSKGKWKLNLMPEKSSFEARDLIVESTDQVTFKNVLVGEVWHASGQSNMEWKMKGCIKHIPLFKAYIQNYPNLRYRAIKLKESLIPQTHLNDKKSWSVFETQTIPEYSAVSFFFALELYRELNVPIGIIETAWGGHPIEPFIPEFAFTGHPVLEQERAYGQAKNYEGLKTMVGGVYARNDSWLPGTVYNSRLAPIVPFAIRGSLWYQAESNSGKGEDPRFYHKKMNALMNGWRQAWNQPAMPVYYVQLPQFDAPNWVRMREEQRMAMNHEHTGMAVIHDLYPFGIHPPNKLDVAKRLALWPLAQVYNKEVVYSGPIYSHTELKGREIQVNFKPSQSKLMIGLKTDLHETLKLRRATLQGFEICSAPNQWVRANAKIVGDTVVCSHESIDKPIGVRYAWGKTMPNEFKWNLYNEAGLPASSFISDLALSPFQLDQEP